MRLVIFDLDGTLIWRAGYDRGASVIPRPYLTHFLDQMFREYRVALYTSSTISESASIIAKILTPEQLHSLVFCWFRNNTISVTEGKPSPVGVPVADPTPTEKSLRLVFSRYGPDFDYHNTVKIF